MFARLASSIVASLAICIASSWAVADELRIVQPEIGAVLRAGDRLTVRVAHHSPATTVPFDQGLFFVIEGITPISAYVPTYVGDYLFEVVIPKNVAPGIYTITVIGKQSGRDAVISQPRTFSVDTDDVQSIETSVRTLTLPYVGASGSISIYGVNSIGRFLLPGSLVQFRSSVPGVVSVNSDGRVVALSSGAAVVTVSYKGFTSETRVSIAKLPRRGDFNQDGVIDVGDIALLQGALNTDAVSASDDRDLNGDGKINALDIRILTTLCTKPRCAK